MKLKSMPSYGPGDLVPLRHVWSDPRATPSRRGLLPIGRTSVMKLLRQGAIKSVRLGTRSVFVPFDEIVQIRAEGAVAADPPIESNREAGGESIARARLSVRVPK
jgi:hypothetical protein